MKKTRSRTRGARQHAGSALLDMGYVPLAWSAVQQTLVVTDSDLSAVQGRAEAHGRDATGRSGTRLSPLCARPSFPRLVSRSIKGSNR